MKYLQALFLLPFFVSCSVKSKHASSDKDWALIPFQKADSLNPIFTADSTLIFKCPLAGTEIKWAEKDVFNPAATLRNDTVFLLFRAEDVVGQYNGTSRVGLAWSTDGYNFTSYPSPILYPDNDEYKAIEWEGGCEDPRITESEDGTYILTYTSYDGKTARLMIASSTDLMKWNKHGPAFTGSLNDRYANTWSKSGSIVSDYSSGKPVAKKINGKYWMYWGDQNIWAATSDDLIKWTPVQNVEGDTPFEDPRGIAKELTDLKTVIGPRKNKFDSDLIEPGPPAMYTEKGIVLIYNSRNIPAIGDKDLAEGTYAAGQVLLDKNDPLKVINRLEDYFMKPEKDYEITGQVNQVCFLEGLVKYKGKWFVYYGTADSKIAVATSTAK
jgi:beta-1,2-mannosidase